VRFPQIKKNLKTFCPSFKINKIERIWVVIIQCEGARSAKWAMLSLDCNHKLIELRQNYLLCREKHELSESCHLELKQWAFESSRGNYNMNLRWSSHQGLHCIQSIILNIRFILLFDYKLIAIFLFSEH
jgi:hypothetical protein